MRLAQSNNKLQEIALSKGPKTLERALVVRVAAALALFSFAFYLAYLYGMSFRHVSASPFWPPDAVLLAALLLTRRRVWWLFLLAPIPIRFFIETPPDVPVWFLPAVFVIDSLKALISAAILRKLYERPLRLETMPQLINYIVIAVVATPMICAFLGAFTWMVLGENFWTIWSRWFLGNALATLILTPMILYWANEGAAAFRSAGIVKILEAGLLFIALTVVGAEALGGRIPWLGNSPVLIYLPFPLLLYAAVRFGLLGISSALSLLAVLAIWNAEHGLGPLSAPSPGADILPLQLYLFVTSIPLLCVAVLVHERQRSAAALEETRAQLDQTEKISLVMVTHFGLDGRWLKVPPTLCALLGYSEEALLSGYYMDIVYADDLAALREQCSRLIDGEIQSFELERRLVRGTGSLTWVYLNCSLVMDSGGKPLHFLTYFRDISERKQVEEALRESEMRFHAMADNSPVMIWVSDENKTCTYVNRAWLEFTGRRFDQELGNGWADSLHPNDRDRSLEKCSSSFDKRESFTMEHDLRRFDGEYRRLLVSAVPRYTPDGSYAGFIGSVLDVTDLKRAEQELQLLTGQLINLQDEERRRIAGELHDSLGQSLVIIKNRAMICLRDISDPDQLVDQLQEISAAADSAINEVHEIAHNLRPYELDRLGLAKAIEAMVEKLRKSSMIDLSTDIDSIDGLLCPPAETSVYRIVQEALSNVMKHAEATKASVSLKVDADKLVVSVIDNGKGIRPRSGSMTSGGGFGLAGISERARMIGGIHAFHSEAEKGTAVIVTIGLKGENNDR